LVPSVPGGASDEAEEEEEDPNIGEFFEHIADLLFPVECAVKESLINRIAPWHGNGKGSTKRTGVSYGIDKVRDHDLGKSLFKFSPK
jgi:hypothetical protein